MNECLRLNEELAFRDLMMTIGIAAEDVWGEQTTLWLVFFYLYVAIFVVLFCLLIGLTLYVMTQRKRSERQKVKKVNTFYAINSMIIALGVFRVIHLALDPFGVEGWIEGQVPRHILSIVFSMGFPTLTASYLLVFITLWMSRQIKGGFKCIQKLSVLIPLCAFQYVVTLIVELITISNQYEVIYLIIACDLFFSLWGIFICVAFLLAGYLLIKSIGIGNRESTTGLENLQTNKENSLKNGRYTHAGRLGSRRFTFTKRQNSTLTYKRRGVEHRQRAMMKVTIVTCMSALLGILYSILSTAIAAVMMHLLLQNECVNEARGSRVVWLLLQYIGRSLELLLCLLLLYSVADTTKMMKYLFKQCKMWGCVEGETVDFNMAELSKTMSDLDSSTLERLDTLNHVTKDDKNDKDRLPLPSLTEETILDNGNGIVKNGTKEHVFIENRTIKNENGTIKNGDVDQHHGLLRSQVSGPPFGQGNNDMTLLSVKELLPKSHSDSSIVPNGKQTSNNKYITSNEIL